ncbi:MAG: glycosyltransferase [Pelagibacteraceae bacterium TMED216]|nr:MAG: glycosyltransferase [Pelagibacteraceae bacterium TMED216]|tara:strand:+ start:718 stop:1665 length:948 start_codon:yes stop_codon:yes gene_type:complete
MDISIVIPLLNESESLEPLHDWIIHSLETKKKDFEIVFIDDGSSDDSWEVISKLALEQPNTHGIQFSKNFGKSQALHAGFKAVKGNYVVTMDADLQDSPDEILPMIDQMKEKDLHLISGWKKKRYDSFLLKNLPSKLFNWAARKVSGIKLHDFNCGLKVYQKEVIKNIEVYGEMHRYIPVIAANKGFHKIDEKIVQHQARKFGKTKFGVDRFLNGFLDLITLWFINGFGKRPMHFFGFWGTLMLMVGFGFTVFLGIEKLYLNTQARLITQRPEFYIALTTMILGAQAFIAGFLGEIMVRQNKNIKRYSIMKTTYE